MKTLFCVKNHIGRGSKGTAIIPQTPTTTTTDKISNARTLCATISRIYLAHIGGASKGLVGVAAEARRLRPTARILLRHPMGEVVEFEEPSRDCRHGRKASDLSTYCGGCAPVNLR
jgi:hypothetical protein